MSSKILVIDDDPSLVHLMKTNLEEQGYRVIAGYDGQAAIQMARIELPDLIILDVNMPNSNGIIAAEAIRKSPESKDIPIILLSGETTEQVSPKIQDMRRIMHIKKPVDLAELNLLVRETVQKYTNA